MLDEGASNHRKTFNSFSPNDNLRKGETSRIVPPDSQASAGTGGVSLPENLFLLGEPWNLVEGGTPHATAPTGGRAPTGHHGGRGMPPREWCPGGAVARGAP
jgi:hypothetical protein